MPPLLHTCIMYICIVHFIYVWYHQRHWGWSRCDCKQSVTSIRSFATCPPESRPVTQCKHRIVSIIYYGIICIYIYYNIIINISIFLYFFLSFFISVFLSFFIYFFLIYFSILFVLSILSILSIYLSIHLSIHLSIYLCIYLCIYLSISILHKSRCIYMHVEREGDRYIYIYIHIDVRSELCILCV